MGIHTHKHRHRHTDLRTHRHAHAPGGRGVVGGVIVELCQSLPRHDIPYGRVTGLRYLLRALPLLSSIVVGVDAVIIIVIVQVLKQNEK